VFNISRRKAPAGLCGINFAADGIAITHVLRQPNQLPEVQVCVFKACLDPEEFPLVLSSLVKEYQLQGMACSWVLNDNDYKLLLLDTLSVAPEELASAARWKIKDLIDFPVDEATVDCFPNRKRDKMYVAAARTEFLQKTAQMIYASELDLQFIEIPELALRNINALFPFDKQGLALMVIGQAAAKLILTRQAFMYLTRAIELQSGSFTASSVAIQQQANENLLLEIQRSFDYYKMQLHQAYPAKLLIDAAQPEIITYLTERLTMPVELLNLTDVLSYKMLWNTELQTRCLTALGAALRNDEEVA
jgi:MSHA biogenesis protein MshI